MGFIVNPIAGMGGRVGLKGTDGVYRKALELGAKPVSPSRAVMFLGEMREMIEGEDVKIVTCPKSMGEEEVREAGLSAEVLDIPIGEETTAEDTKEAVKRMLKIGVELLVFVGGDGTARDIYDALGNEDLPVLGVPAGVKMYSGVFANNPSEAAEVVVEFLKGDAQLLDREVMDIDEESFRRNRLSVKLYGYLKSPYVPMRIQDSKAVSPETEDEQENQRAIARCIIEDMDPEGVYILGPGTTVKVLADLLGVEKTLLGVDVYRNGKLIKDLNEERILKEIEGASKVWIVVSPIGRQGMLFGRGNQQISPKVIKRVGRERIIVAATEGKIRGIEDGVLRVDTGDPEVDEYLRGYIKVIVDYRVWRMMKVQ